MRKLNFLAFDDYVSGTTQVFTPAAFNEKLGAWDKLSFQLIGDNASGTSPTASIQIQHSCDQRTFINKNSTAEINAVALPTTGTTTSVGSDTSSAASLGFVRLGITLAGTTPAAHLKIWVTARDTAQ